MYAIVVAIDKKYEHPNQRILLAVDKYDKPRQARHSSAARVQAYEREEKRSRTE
jgi:hypothetical protein